MSADPANISTSRPCAICLELIVIYHFAHSHSKILICSACAAKRAERDHPEMKVHPRLH